MMQQHRKKANSWWKVLLFVGGSRTRCICYLLQCTLRYVNSHRYLWNLTERYRKHLKTIFENGKLKVIEIVEIGCYWTFAKPFELWWQPIISMLVANKWKWSVRSRKSKVRSCKAVRWYVHVVKDWQKFSTVLNASRHFRSTAILLSFPGCHQTEHARQNYAHSTVSVATSIPSSFTSEWASTTHRAKLPYQLGQLVRIASTMVHIIQYCAHFMTFSHSNVQLFWQSIQPLFMKVYYQRTSTRLCIFSTLVNNCTYYLLSKALCNVVYETPNNKI